MHIVSKFHDYYDTASIYGIDKTCVYVREEVKVDIHGNHWNDTPYLLLESGARFNLGKLPRSDSKTLKDREYEFYKNVLGFCGEMYPYIKVVVKKNKVEERKLYFYDQPSFQSFIQTEGLSQVKRYRYFDSWDVKNFNIDSDKGMENFFNQGTWKHLEGIFSLYRTPCFALKQKGVYLSTPLKPIQFMKIKDPQTAFQDIYMYLSGVLGAPPPPKEKISDKVMAASKGHDGEYSFKKPPGKKTRWR